MASVDRKAFEGFLEKVLEREPGDLAGATNLDEIGWDSVAVLSFMAAAEDTYGKVISAERVNKAKSVSDLFALIA